MSEMTITALVVGAPALILGILAYIRSGKIDQQAAKDKSTDALYKIIDELQEENARLRARLAKKNGVGA